MNLHNILSSHNPTTLVPIRPKSAVMESLNTAQKEVFRDWVRFNTEDRPDPEIAAHNFLVEAHPDHHVVRTLETRADLVGFANAGHATYEPLHDNGHDVTRTFRPGGPRLDKKPGKLTDVPTFARLAYHWQGNDFIVYQLSYINRYMSRVKLLYILAPKDGGAALEKGNHPTIDALLVACGTWSKELHDEIYVFDNQEWNKDKGMFESVQSATWDDVILEPKLKDSMIKDVQSFFDNRDLYATFGAPWKRGVILHGVPGNGKTISIKALIKSLSDRPDPVPSLYVKSFDGCQGPKWSMMQVFSHARQMAPCLLIFEDIDSMVREKTRSYFLNEVDGLESNEGILMIGSTNHLDRLDPAIAKRPSRFDRKYHFKVPAYEERLAYCHFWRGKLAKSPIDFPEDMCEPIARMTDGFSFAYLKELFVMSLLTFARGTQDEEPETNGSDAGSTDTVVVERPAPSETEESDDKKKNKKQDEAGDKKEDGSAEDKDKADKEKEKTDRKPPRELPEIEVPEHLAAHALLKVVKSQAKTLLSEMDNTDDDKKPEVDSCPPPWRFRFGGDDDD